MARLLCACVLLLVVIAGSAQFNLQSIGTGTASNDFFGYRLASSTDGSVLAISSSHYPGGLEYGRVLVYACSSAANCSAQQTLAEGSQDDQFGQSLAISGDASFLVVGAYGYNVHAGAAYTYTGTAGSYALQQTITIPGGASMDEFGTAMSLSGDGTVLAVGAIGLSSSTGGVYIFACNPSAGTCGSGTLQTVQGGSPGDQLGFAVILSADGSTIAASATGFANSAGAVYTGTCTSSSAEEEEGSAGCSFGQEPLFGAPGWDFGVAISLSSNGTLLAVGADRAADQGMVLGAAWIYWCSGGSCSYGTLVRPPVEQRGARFGASVALSPSGATLAIGAPAAGAGTVYLFSCAWVNCSTAVNVSVGGGSAPTPQPGDMVGFAVALTEGLLFAGALGHASSAGAVYAGVAPAITSLVTKQYAGDAGVQFILSSTDPKSPLWPWFYSPLAASFLTAATPAFPHALPLYRCHYNWLGVPRAAFGFGTTPNCNVAPPSGWADVDVIGYVSSVQQAPFTIPLWLCQTAVANPSYTGYYGWVPGYGACPPQTSVVSKLGFVVSDAWPPTVYLFTLQYGNETGVQLVVAPTDPAYPSAAPWDNSPVDAYLFWTASTSAAPFPDAVPLYRCHYNGTGAAPGAYGFGTTPQCNVVVPAGWSDVEVIAYISSVQQGPFTDLLQLCQTAEENPNYPGYYGWVPSFGVCGGTTLVANLGYVIGPLL